MTGTGINHAKIVDTVAHPDDGSPVVGSDFNADHVINGDVNWNNHKITSLADPTGTQDAATKNYVDLASQGVQWKAPVRAATVSAGTLATSFANGQVVDGYTLVTGDRILIKDQASGAENGIYIVQAAGAPTRADDADTSAEIIGSTVFSENGTVNADAAFMNTNTSTITIGTTAITYVQFTGAAQITAGNGLSKSGNTLTIDTSITMDLTSTQTLSGSKTFALAKISGAGAGVGTIAYANSASNATFTIPATTGTAALLAQLTDGTTITGLVNAQIASGAAIAYSKLALTGAILNADLAGSIAPSKITGTAAILGANTFTAAQNVLTIVNQTVTETYNIAGTTTFNFDTANMGLLTVGAGNTTLASANLGAGKSHTVFITSDSSTRTLTLPAGWIRVGAATGTTITCTANKHSVLTLTSTTSADSGVRFSFAEEG